MKTSVIITEFNPLHLGHEYFIQKVRRLSSCDSLIAVMSGDFVQRGEPALFNKYVRTASALKAGVDLVLELPVRYALGSAGSFASGAVSIADSLGCVDELWFGSESGDIHEFLHLAQILKDEPADFKTALSDELKKGASYPAARAAAVRNLYGEAVSSLLEGPNNVLGLEYCAAARKNGSFLRLHTLKREGGGYNDTSADAKYPSAAAVRKAYQSKGAKAVRHLVPDYSFELLSAEPGGITSDDFSSILKYRLLLESSESLALYNGVGADLALRIKNLENECISFSDFALKVKSRNYTYTHVCRALFNIILGIKKPSESDLPQEDDSFAPPLVRILGKKDCAPLLSVISREGRAQLTAGGSELNSPDYREDLFASNLYESIRSLRFGTGFIHECSRKLIRL